MREGGVPLPAGKGSGQGTMPPPQKFFFDFGSQNFRCILCTIFFYSSSIRFRCKSVVSRVKVLQSQPILGLESKYNWWMCSI